MHSSLATVLCLLTQYISLVLGLPYVFERAITDRTALAPRQSDVQRDLGPSLSKGAAIYFPGSSQYAAATDRWSAYAQPQIAVVVEPGNAKDVATTVQYANKHSMAFLAVNKGHGSTTTLAKAKNAIEIHVRTLNSITIASDGNSASCGGGVYNQEIIDAAYAKGLACASGSCACVGVMGAALGGGLGRYQGYFGLLADNIVDADLVLADGSTTTVSKTNNSDLFWAIQGAGHNFGIVTRYTLKTYKAPSLNWYYITMAFTQDKLEKFVAQVNKMMNNGNQPKELMNYFLYARNPQVDPVNPVIIFTIYYIGTEAAASQYVKPYLDLSPVFQKSATVPYPQLSAATGLGDQNFSCTHGYNRLQYPVGLLNYNVTNLRAVYSEFNKTTAAYPAFNLSTTVFEGYSLQGVKAVPADSTAYPHRDDNILASILAVYAPNPSLDSAAVAFARRIRDLMQSGQPGRPLNAYVNYAFGDETQEQVYGYEPWRLQRLRGLKKKYDPQNQFGFYEPIQT